MYHHHQQYHQELGTQQQPLRRATAQRLQQPKSKIEKQAENKLKNDRRDNNLEHRLLCLTKLTKPVTNYINLAQQKGSQAIEGLDWGIQIRPAV